MPFLWSHRHVSIFDLPGAYTCAGAADELDEVYHMAKDCLALHLYGMEQDGDEIPSPSRPSDIAVAPRQSVALIEVWMPPYRDLISEKAVKKTLTIPKWLDELAVENNVNFSRVLQDGLKRHLGLTDKRTR
ncbi:type II toxin-antitoxin system HicB family antitoxin [Paenibacillus sp. GCM10012307]|uniref:type II toxin-antitoxin system HicB family antitoxin n=1 Tax=Paenibacillus TaxID=44249 RepID=UPI001E5B19C2|nr:type II toxin-antitoxin system HicB family antitoxin [Paenibacillus roseus]